MVCCSSLPARSQLQLPHTVTEHQGFVWLWWGESAPDTALDGPNGPIRLRFGEGRGRSAAAVRLAGAPSRDVVFGPFGGVMDPVPTLTFTMIGGDERGVLALLTLSPDGSYTVLVVNPQNRIACVVSTGSGWEAVEHLPGRGS